MNQKPMKESLKTALANRAFLTLGAGVVVGALAMAAVVQNPSSSALRRAPDVTVQSRPVADIKTESLEMLRALDESFAKLAEYIEPAVVLIRAEGGRQADIMGRRMPEMAGSGSGVIFRPDGWIVTNDHVVNGFDKVTVVLSDGREFPGKITRAEDNDIALVKIEAKDLPTVQFADSEKVRPGQFAIAVGAPFGFEKTFTVGHVSALGRSTAVPDSRLGQTRGYFGLIQTDAAINMGNSGGPLLNIEGQVIGINTAIFSGTGTNVGIGFAIPANQVRLIAETLMEKGKIVRGFLGLIPADVKEYRLRELGLDGGAVIEEIPNDGPSAIAGLKKGDIITRIGEVDVRGELDLRNSMLRYAPGQTVRVEYVRDGKTGSAEVRLGSPPKNPTLERTPPKKGDDGNEKLPELFKRFEFPEFELPFPKLKDRDDKEDVGPLREGQAYLGVGVESLSATLRKQFHVPENVQGVVVTKVQPGSVADKLGLQQGDVILQLGEKAIREPSDLKSAMEGVKWGDTRRLKTARFGVNSRVEQDRPVTFR
jgi:serine protease Do